MESTADGALPTMEKVRPAATTALLRDRRGRLEVLLTTRPKQLRFMPGATVFPGGAIAPADRDPRWEQASTLTAEAAVELLGEGGGGDPLSWFVCALREAFEEVGFITLSGGDSPNRTHAADPSAFLNSCLANKSILATHRLVPAGRWVTPLGSPARFDARFFIAAVPSGWEPDPDPSEVAACEWAAPVEALGALGRDEALMAPPTIEMLQRLAEFDTVDDALSGIAGRGVGATGAIISARLAPNIQVVLAPNPGLMTGPGTNTYLVGRDKTAVIDPAVGEDAFVESVLARAGTVSRILVTHRHLDHTGGVSAIAAATGAPVHAWGRDEVAGLPVLPLVDGDALVVGGTIVRAVHTPGHSSDHLCFHLADESVLFSGDTILGEGTSVIAPPDGDMAAYLRSLSRLEKLVPKRIYPGHFRPLDDGPQEIRRYIDHRLEREAAIRGVLDAGPLSVSDIVTAVYVDTPVAMHDAAELSVLAHLRKLSEEGVVVERGRGWELQRLD